MVKPIEHVFALHFERIRLGIRCSWVCLDTPLRVPPPSSIEGPFCEQAAFECHVYIFYGFYAVCANFIARRFKKTIGISFTVCDYNSRVTW